MGLHRATQLALPITVAGAGLPSLATLTGEAKSYAERIFTFPVIGSLTGDQPLEALEVPAADEEVRWAPEALTRVVEVTGGYPYFLQEFGKQAWDVAEGPHLITLDDVERSIPVATAELDDGCGPVGPATQNGPTCGPWPSSVPDRCGRWRWPSCWARRPPPSGPPATAC
jgi:hypothetical protein